MDKSKGITPKKDVSMVSEEPKKTPWGEFQARVRELSKLSFRDNVKLSSFLKSEKPMNEWSDIEILQRALFWAMNLYEKTEVDSEKKMDKLESKNKNEVFEIDTEFKGLKEHHLVAKNKSLNGFIIKKVRDFYVSRGKVENLINPAPKNYWKSMENLNDEDIDKLMKFNIKCYQDVPIYTSEGKDTEFFCFEDNKTISDSILKNVIFKEKTKGFVCVGKIEGLTNPYDSEICNLLELSEEEKSLIDDLGYKYDYTKYKKKIKDEIKIEESKVEEIKTKGETPKPKKVKSVVGGAGEETPKPEEVPLHIRKKNIPKYIKTLVWNKYIGDNIAKAKCVSCRETEIRNVSFHCGHVRSEANSGDLNINNLRPICASCNLGMGTRDMNSFTKEYFGWTV